MLYRTYEIVRYVIVMFTVKSAKLIYFKMISRMNKLTYWSDGKACPFSETVKCATKNTVNKTEKEKKPLIESYAMFCHPFRLVSHISIKDTRHQEKGPLLGALSTA